MVSNKDIVARLYEVIESSYPMMLAGVREAHQADAAIVDEYFPISLSWMRDAFGDEALQKIADGYAFFTTEVNMAQIRYEKTGKYAASSFSECNRLIYQNQAYMTHYYWGVYAILFCWSHYVELMRFYMDRFVGNIAGGRILEVAPGHGTWGLLAAHVAREAELHGIDISPTFLDFAPRVAKAAGMSGRCHYKCADATSTAAGTDYDHAICCFMLEHLEDPAAFLRSLAPQLRVRGRAFVTLALTAAQPDHIYEFKEEFEALEMAEKAGFRVVESICLQPRRLLPNARYVPRIQGMILEKV